MCGGKHTGEKPNEGYGFTMRRILAGDRKRMGICLEFIKEHLSCSHKQCNRYHGNNEEKLRANSACVMTIQAVLIVPLKINSRSLPLIVEKKEEQLEENK